MASTVIDLLAQHASIKLLDGSERMRLGAAEMARRARLMHAPRAAETIPAPLPPVLEPEAARIAAERAAETAEWAVIT
jgi:hypothetical protein